MPASRNASKAVAQHIEFGTGYSARIAMPFGVVGVRCFGGQVTRLEYLPPGVATMSPVDPLSREVARQLKAFLSDPAFRFDLPCRIEGSTFQRSVWDAITAIPSGETQTYGQIAKSLRTAARAVGTCCGANQLPLVIPCHRVVGAGGIGGFMHTRAEGSALNIKRWLLRHEGALR